MSRPRFDLLPPDTPLMFADGSAVYKKLAQEYITHDVGYFIVAPSGAGKTHFIDRQTEKHWMDGDVLWMSALAHPDSPWWKEGKETIVEVDQRSDIITIEAKKLGFWILGASNAFLKPDAIVVPDWATHKQWILAREKGNYDGGVTSDQHAQVIEHRGWILKWAEQGVPKFKTVEEATRYLSSKSPS